MSRTLARGCVLWLFCAALAVLPAQEPAAAARHLNVLLLTADDLSCDSVGAFGCELEGVTPHLDALARDGMRFLHAHVAVAICQPCRASLMTGRYPPNSGALGFDPIRPGVPTLPEALRAVGYLTGVLSKVPHTLPSRAQAFDVRVPASELGNGRDADAYARAVRAFLERAVREQRPFFLNVNASDPHRPFARGAAVQDDDGDRAGDEPRASAPYSPAEIPLPGFLPDLPEVRAELARYFTSVRRGDGVLGAVLDVLAEAPFAEAGFAERTLVVFLSDHGMSQPFAKTNCYRHSTHTPLIVRWPGAVAAGSVDAQHVVSSVDLAPTILEALGLPPLDGADGRSLLRILRGGREAGRDHVFASIDTTSARRAFPMRAVVGRRFGYIWNAWSDGTTRMQSEALGGQSFKAMQRAAGGDEAIAARVRHCLLRTPEELYDYAADPDALRDLAGSPEHHALLGELRGLLREHLERTGDAQRERFAEFLRGR